MDCTSEKPSQAEASERRAPDGRVLKLPAEQPAYISKRQARAFLREAGLDPVSPVTADAAELCERLASILKRPVCDGTPELALRASGFKARHTALYDMILEVQERNRPEVVLLLSRDDVREGFLGGFLYYKAFVNGDFEAVSKELRESGASPGALLVASEFVLEIPVFACTAATTAAAAARASLGLGDLPCCACRFVCADERSCRSFFELECGHFVHVNCYKIRCAKGQPCCPSCGLAFLVETIPEPFLSQSHSRINELAAQVRHAMALDGLEGPLDFDPVGVRDLSGGPLPVEEDIDEFFGDEAVAGGPGGPGARAAAAANPDRDREARLRRVMRMALDSA